MSDNIILPRQDEKGNYYISYSQITSWNDAKSFNLRILGKEEYILQYFLGEDFGDQGWAEFGQDVENYVCYRDCSEDEIATLDDEIRKKIERYGRDEKLVSESLKSFSEDEKKIMDTIEPLDNHQQEVRIQFDGFYLLGYIDDMNKDMTHIRDYKTGSLNSSKKYYKDDYYQLDIYGMWVKQETGKFPEKAEVCIIERAGNCFKGGGRKVLSVKGDVWNHDRELTNDRADYLRGYINRTAQEISECYKVFLKMIG